MASHRLRSARSVLQETGVGSQRKMRLRLECGHVTEWKTVRSGDPLAKRYRCPRCRDEPKDSRVRDA